MDGPIRFVPMPCACGRDETTRPALACSVGDCLLGGEREATVRLFHRGEW